MRKQFVTFLFVIGAIYLGPCASHSAADPNDKDTRVRFDAIRRPDLNELHASPKRGREVNVPHHEILPQMSVPVQIRTTIDLTTPSQGLSALCGFTISRHIEGNIDATLFLDGEGNPVREIDTSPSLRYTFFSTSTGKSVSYPGTGTLITDYYHDGTALATLDGFLTFIQIPGGDPLFLSIGRTVFSTTIVGITPDGLPQIGPPIEILFDAGIERGSILGACVALAP